MNRCQQGCKDNFGEMRCSREHDHRGACYFERLSEPVGYVESLRAALGQFRDAFANRGETTSLHEWNERLKVADAFAARALAADPPPADSGLPTDAEASRNMAQALARIREIADFPNTPGGDMLPDLMGRLETIWKIANGETPARSKSEETP